MRSRPDFPHDARVPNATFTSLNQRILAMAEDWPEAKAKYGFRLDEKANPPVRTFGVLRETRAWPYRVRTDGSPRRTSKARLKCPLQSTGHT